MTGGEANYINFGYESTFKTAVTANKTFGENVSIRSLDLRNNVRRLFRLGSRDAVEFVAGQFEGALGIEFDLSDPWFLKGVLGTLTTTGTSPYYHTYTGANKPPSMTIENGIDYELSGIVRKYLGSIIGDCRITCAVGDEPTRVSLTILYADETLQISGVGSQTAPSDPVYPFSYGSFEYPTGTTIANTESFELTITNNAALKYALGSRKASRYDMRQRTYDITTTNYFDDAASYLERFYGAPSAVTPNTTMVSGDSGIFISLSNGQVSAQRRRYAFTVTNAIIDHHSLPEAVENENMETVDIMGGTLAIECTNNTSTEP